MAAAVALRTDFTGSALRHLARYTRDANQARRLLALAVLWLKPRKVALSWSRIMSDDPQKNSPDRENRIRERAYHLWEADGRPEGREQVYWEQAESMIGKEESEEQRG